MSSTTKCSTRYLPNFSPTNLPTHLLTCLWTHVTAYLPTLLLTHQPAFHPTYSATYVAYLPTYPTNMPMCPPNHSPLYHSTYPSPPYLLTFVSYPRVYLLVYFHVQPLSNPPGYLFTYSPISLPINHLLSCLKTYPKIYQKDLCKQQPLFGAKICADICARISSVSRCEQFSESGSGGKLRASKNRWCPRTNVSSYFQTK